MLELWRGGARVAAARDARTSLTRRALERARPLRFRIRTGVRGAALAGALRLAADAPARGADRPLPLRLRRRARGVCAAARRGSPASSTPVSLSDAVERLRLGRADGDEVVVTFDDGFRNQLVNAAPLLAEHGVQRVLLPRHGAPRRIARAGAHVLPRAAAPAACRVEPLDWESASRLLELGHEIGSHTRSHPESDGAPAGGARGRARGLTRGALAAARRRAGALRVPVRRADTLLRVGIAQAARTAGYESCATAISGAQHVRPDLYALRRDHLGARGRSASWRISLAREGRRAHPQPARDRVAVPRASGGRRSSGYPRRGGRRASTCAAGGGGSFAGWGRRRARRACAAPGVRARGRGAAARRGRDVPVVARADAERAGGARRAPPARRDRGALARQRDHPGGDVRACPGAGHDQRPPRRGARITAAGRPSSGSSPTGAMRSASRPPHRRGHRHGPGARGRRGADRAPRNARRTRSRRRSRACTRRASTRSRQLLDTASSKAARSRQPALSEPRRRSATTWR